MKGWQGFEYAEVVHRIAAYLVPRRDQADVLGNMQDDYVSDLCLEAILASRAFQQRGGDEKGEFRYVLKSLWNYARTQARSRFRRRRFYFRPLYRELDPISLEAQAEARSSIRALQKNLDKMSLGLLMQLAAAEGDLREAWAADPRYHRRYFVAKAKEAREAGKRLLQN